MNKKLFVGGLSYNTTNDSLRELFEEHGNVLSADVIRDRESGRSKGFGFVEFETPGEAEQAMSALNGATLDGRSITVAEAKPQRERTPGRGGYGGGGERRGGGSGGRSSGGRGGGYGGRGRDDRDDW